MSETMAESTAAARAALPDDASERGAARRAIAAWLLACCVLVYLMVVLGGVTRLTGSGLSIVEWKPVVGIVPPLGDAAWQAEFASYRESPEFRYVNAWMSVDDFKRIYWLEYLHRLLGRLIGVVFLVPFLWFLARRRIPRGLAPHLAGMFVLGGLQGAIGWYMVASGLVDDPRVSQYRLATHLGLAVLIYAWMFSVAMRLLHPRGGISDGPSWLRRAAPAVTALAAVTMASGAFVAGLDAGLFYNTFPRMAGEWIPPGLWTMAPGWKNLFENVTTVQFDHRVLAIATLVAVLGLWSAALRVIPAGAARLWLHGCAAVCCVQVALGIGTLLMKVPVSLGAAHQAGALALLTCLLGATLELRRGVVAPIGAVR